MGVYQPIDYVIYIGILFILMFVALRFLFNKIKIDKYFVITISPYMITAIAIRVLTDVEFFPRSKLWSITPGVYIVSFVLAFLFILIGYELEKKDIIAYWKLPLIVGFIPMIYLLYNLSNYINFPSRLIIPPLMALSITAAVYMFSPIIYRPIREFENIAMIFGHLLDGCATFYAINYFGFGEEHLLPLFLIDISGNAIIMVPLKLALILVVVYLLDNLYKEEKVTFKEKEISILGLKFRISTLMMENFYLSLKVIVFILGFGPGVRDTLLPALL
ncbi:MAG TPA: DUF63 family protein [Methanofastidiosum sp.]|nr:DUF63 family protein [Methanofastidiosum sp.]